MVIKTTTHNFEYSITDIEDLIKGDVANRLKMQPIPIIESKIKFNIINHGGALRLQNVEVRIEIPG